MKPHLNLLCPSKIGKLCNDFSQAAAICTDKITDFGGVVA
jgi:hypothetical protein